MKTIAVLLFTAIMSLAAFATEPCPYDLQGDLTKDCVVNLADLSVFAANWLIDCKALPRDPACTIPLDSSLIADQIVQFEKIKDALKSFRAEYGTFPPSNDNQFSIFQHPLDPNPYCGANKLAEALVGQDMLGFHPNSDFRSDGTFSHPDGSGHADIFDHAPVYHADADYDGLGNPLFQESAAENIDNRTGPFIDSFYANPQQMQDIYSIEMHPFRPDSLVLCDVFEKPRTSGKITGMPILYFQANTFFAMQDHSNGFEDDIYRLDDNLGLIHLGMQLRWDTQNYHHSLIDPIDFDRMILNPEITAINRPYRANSYILISAGPDSLYGTADDMLDFEYVAVEAEIDIASVPKVIEQRAQFHQIEAALEIFKEKMGTYPPSYDNQRYPGSLDHATYGGANKLAEAMVGLDFLGFSPNSDFRSNGTFSHPDGSGHADIFDHAPVYHADADYDGLGNPLFAMTAAENIDSRLGPYLPLEVSNAFKMKDISSVDLGVMPHSMDCLVLCDIFKKRRPSGKFTGMPILYYRANTIYTTQDFSNGIEDDIYNFEDNLYLTELQWCQGWSYQPYMHKMHDPLDFEKMILNPEITAIQRPYKADSFILISAGPDGIYGTADDVTNFNQ